MNKNTQKKPLSNAELSSFCDQVAMILQSGISSIEGITIMLEDAETDEEKEILQTISKELSATGNFYQALESTNLFPNYMLHLVDIGEQTGKLDEVMASLSDHYNREDTIAHAVKNAVTYPCIMVGMMIVVILVLIMKVLPIFNQVFHQLGTQMSGFSIGLMHIGNVISNYSIIFIAILAILILLILYVTKTSRGKNLLMRVGYKFHFSRSIYESIAACRFTSGMALTLSSGLNPDHSMSLVTELTDDPIFRKKLDHCKESMDEGIQMTDALFSTNIFKGIYARMASIGYKTGSLDHVMKKIATQYEKDIDTQLSNILAVLEPTIVIILSLIVGIVLLSVMLPLMGIMASL